MRGLYIFYFYKPESITYTIPSIVTDVSAIFVATTIFLYLSGSFLNTFYYSKELNAPYKGYTTTGSASS